MTILFAPEVILTINITELAPKDAHSVPRKTLYKTGFHLIFFFNKKHCNTILCPSIIHFWVFLFTQVWFCGKELCGFICRILCWKLIFFMCGLFYFSSSFTLQSIIVPFQGKWRAFPFLKGRSSMCVCVKPSFFIFLFAMLVCLFVRSTHKNDDMFNYIKGFLPFL